jgi:hypothetical protein
MLSKWFCDTSTGTATGAARCGSFVGKAFNLLVVSSRRTWWHDDLRGSGRLSVIPYIHGRTEVYCAQACLAWAFYFFNPLEVASTRAFYSSRSDSFNETRGPTGGPEVVETLYNI